MLPAAPVTATRIGFFVVMELLQLDVSRGPIYQSRRALPPATGSKTNQGPGTTWSRLFRFATKYSSPASSVTIPVSASSAACPSAYVKAAVLSLASFFFWITVMGDVVPPHWVRAPMRLPV